MLHLELIQRTKAKIFANHTDQRKDQILQEKFTFHRLKKNFTFFPPPLHVIIYLQKYKPRQTVYFRP